MQNNEKDQKDNLLSQNGFQLQEKPTQIINQTNTQTTQIITKPEDQIIDPIEELIKNNNVIPLLVMIDKIDLDRKIQDKPLLSIMAQRFIPLGQILKNRQINFPLDYDRRTPLHYAIEADDVKAAAWLIQKGNPNQRDNYGHTPIIDAIRLGRQRIFLLCLKNKLYDQRAPIFAAIHNRHWELKVLHGMGINIFAYRDEQNKSAFERALQYNSFDCAQFMIKVRPDLDINKYKSFTQSKGLIRRLNKIQLSLSLGQRMKQLLRPFLIFIALICGFNGSLLGLESLYQNTRPFYYILMILIISTYGLTYIFGKLSANKVQYTQKDSLSKILRQPHYTTLQDICPMCVHLTQYQYDHCYVCGYCVHKYHFHSFTCINKSNQVFWILGEFIWFYLIWSVINQFIQFVYWNQLSTVSVSSFTAIRVLSIFQYLSLNHKYVAIVWFIFLIFLLLHQFFYCLTLLGMICMRRKFQQVIHSQKYHHLYYVVKVDDNYMNKQKRLFAQGLLPGIQRSIRNLLVYFFIDG